MKICPYCLQGEILNAKIIKTNEIIQICDECDTVWKSSEIISDKTGRALDLFMKHRNCSCSWREFEILKS